MTCRYCNCSDCRRDSDYPDWPDCKEVQCNQLHECLDVLLQMLTVECPKSMYAIGKMVRIARQIDNLRDRVAKENKS